MPSFDIVSEIDHHEVQNAVDNANRELQTRFDFRGVSAEFSLSKLEATLKAEADFQLQQMLDILRAKLVQRKIDPTLMDEQDVEHTGKTYAQKVIFKEGIESDLAKKIVKLIKESKIKAQTAIQGDKLRVTGKKRDDLQQVIALVKSAELGQPFQYNNFRD
jgi:uncharacterized protein YajQ (UPF0234 family)